MPKFSELPKLSESADSDINGFDELAILDNQIVKLATVDDIKDYVSANIDVTFGNGGGGGNTITLFTQPKQIIESTIATDDWTFLNIPSGFMFVPIRGLIILDSVTANEKFTDTNPPGWGRIPGLDVAARKKNDNSEVYSNFKTLEPTIFFDNFASELDPRGASSVSGYKMLSSWKLFAFSNWGIQLENTSPLSGSVRYIDQRLGIPPTGNFVSRTAEVEITRFVNSNNLDKTFQTDNFLQNPTFFDDIKITAELTKGTVDGTNLTQAELSFGITGQLIPNPLV